MDLLTLFFSLCFPMLAGHDLLDQIPSDVYWKSKGITFSGEALVAQLKVEKSNFVASGLIEQLGDDDFAKREAAMQALILAGPGAAKEVEAATKSSDPEVAARANRIARHLQQGKRDGENRRLMALRGLGELEYTPALAQLKAIEAQESGDYARAVRRAITLIEAAQKPDQPVPDFVTKNVFLPPDLELEADLHLMPASAMGVTQIAFTERLKMPLNAVLTFQPLFGRGIPREEREPVYFAKLIQLVDEIGNVRIDSVTASFTYLESERVAFATCVVRGKYNWNAIKPLLLKEGFRSHSIEKQEVMRTEGDKEGVILIPLSDTRLIAIVGEFPESLPIKEMLVGEDSTKLIRQNERLWKLIPSVDKQRPAWAAMVAPPEFAKVPWMAALDEATLKGSQEGSELKFLMSTSTKDPAKLEPTWKAFDKSLEHAQNESEQLATIIPALKPLAEILISINYEKLAKGAVFKAHTPDIRPLFAFPLVLSSGEWSK